jgi:hypothetical protein
MQMTRFWSKDMTDNPPTQRASGDHTIPVYGPSNGFVDEIGQRENWEETS